MNSQQGNPETASTDKQATSPRRRPFLKGLLTGGLVGTLVAGGVGAFAQHAPHSPFCRGGHGMRHAMHNPEVMRERIDFAVDWALSRVDASPEQRDKVTAIAVAAAGKLTALRTKHRANREAAIAALTQPQVNRDELENIRGGMLALGEEGSQVITKALADAADVLTLEQRIKLAEMAERWTGRRHDM